MSWTFVSYHRTKIDVPANDKRGHTKSTNQQRNAA